MEHSSLCELFEMFPDEKAATLWIESNLWPDGERFCLRCGCCDSIQDVPNSKPMPYRCGDCSKYFSLRTGTVMERSPIPLHKWLVASFLMIRGKGVSSVQLAKDLGITQKSAWFMAHRLRLAMTSEHGMFAGPIEVDETYLGGKNKNRHFDKKKPGRGTAGKTPVIGIKDRATNTIAAVPVVSANRATAEEIVLPSISEETPVYTDDSKIYTRLDNHESVNHSHGEYVRGDVHTNGVESFWSMLKRAYMGVYHWWSPKHAHRYVDECAGHYNTKSLSTLNRLSSLFNGMQGKRLTYKELTSS